MSVKHILLKKGFYSPEIADTIKSISFNHQNTEVLGSFGIRSQLYTSDIDCFETVKLNKSSVKTKFHNIIKSLLKDDTVYI